MRAMKFAVVAMGLAIVGASVTLVVLLLQRAAGPRASAPVLLEQPAGTWIAGVTGVQDGVAVWLSGGGVPDRVVLVDPRRGTRGEVRLVERGAAETQLGQAPSAGSLGQLAER